MPKIWKSEGLPREPLEADGMLIVSILRRPEGTSATHCDGNCSGSWEEVRGMEFVESVQSVECAFILCL